MDKIQRRRERVKEKAIEEGSCSSVFIYVCAGGTTSTAQAASEQNREVRRGREGKEGRRKRRDEMNDVWSGSTNAQTHKKHSSPSTEKLLEQSSFLLLPFPLLPYTKMSFPSLPPFFPPSLPSHTRRRIEKGTCPSLPPPLPPSVSRLHGLY